jgi:hypothetical protein
MDDHDPTGLLAHLQDRQERGHGAMVSAHDIQMILARIAFLENENARLRRGR